MAKIQGIEIKSNKPPAPEREQQSPGLVERLKQKKNKDMESEAQNKGNAKFSDGVGYQIIRG